MTVKLDLEKTYDCISWSFLRSVLIAVGFEEHMVEFIMFSVSPTSLSIL